MKKKIVAKGAAKKSVKKAVKPPAKTTSSKKLNSNSDVINLILEDHKPLKQLIKIMKNSDKGIDARMAAFAEFAPLFS